MNKNQVYFIFSILSFIIFIIFFKKYPNIDIEISSIFFINNTFPMYNNTIVRTIDRIVQFGAIATWITIIVHLYQKERQHNKHNSILIRKLLYISTVCILGGIGMIFAIKYYFMRCRPINIEYFGGNFPFSDVWTRNYIGNTTKCLSFVSGHSAIGFLIYSIAFVSEKKQSQLMLLSTIVGFTFGFIRIIQGQHFISDVIFAGYIIFFTSAIIYYIFKKLNILT